MEQTPVEELKEWNDKEKFYTKSWISINVQLKKALDKEKALQAKHEEELERANDRTFKSNSVCVDELKRRDEQLKQKVIKAYEAGFGECVQDFASNATAYYERTHVTPVNK
jgi:hypothetical protein